MKVTIFGTRGTSPVTRPEFAKYGGETTSALVEGDGGDKIALDAGTGIRMLETRLEKTEASSLLILMTHYHLDHVMGLPSFQHLYDANFTITIAAPRRNTYTAEEVVPRIMEQPFWPRQIGNVQATVKFLTLEGETSKRPLRRGALEIRWCPLHHPGGCSAYRIDDTSSGAAVVFATDVEWGLSNPAEKEAFRRLCAEPAFPGLLIFDGQFSAKNYSDFRGWGHSTWEDAVEAARGARARRLIVTHHDPESDDQLLDGVAAELGSMMPEAELARGGMEVQVT